MILELQASLILKITNEEFIKYVLFYHPKCASLI